MDNKLLLIHAIMLLYWESQLEDPSVDSSDMVEKTIENIKLPEVTLIGDDTRDTLEGLAKTAISLCNRVDKATRLDKDVLLQRLRVYVRKDDDIIDAITEGLFTTEDEQTIRLKCRQYSSGIRAQSKNKEFTDALRKQYADIIYSSDDDKRTLKDKVNQLVSAFEPFHSEAAGDDSVNSIAGVVDSISFDEKEDLERAFKEAEEQASNEGTLTLGFQALNRMFGAHNGIRRGDFGAIAAFQHNFKSGMALKMFKHVALYNTPKMINPNKKPLLLHISSENSMTDNLLILYADLWENEYKQACDIKSINIEEAIAYVQDRLGVNGWYVSMLRVNPSEMGFRELFQLIMYYETNGYEIHLCVMDYLNMLSKEGCIQGPTGSDTRDLFRRVRNFMSVRKIAFVTPHQISTEAKYLLRQDVDLIVKGFPGKSYWDSCKTLDQEIDWAMWIHIEKVGDESFLTVARDKHRGVFPVTPEADKFFILPFHDIGSIHDDIHGEDQSMKSLTNVGAGDGFDEF